MRRIAALCICLLLLPVWAAAQTPAPIEYIIPEEAPTLPTEDLLEVHLINVEAADCILLRLNGLTMMVDSGRESTAGVVLDYLQALGIERLDYAFLTHPHDDHFGGYTHILRAIPVDSFILPESFREPATYRAKAFDDLLIELRIPTVYVQADQDGIPFGGATIWPYQWLASWATTNDQSMVLRVQYGERAVLLAADVENNGQKELALAHGDALRADILKMPHHGLAAYMREFHEAVQPALATFSNYETRIRNTIKLTEQRDVAWLLTTGGTLVMVTDGLAWRVWQLPEGR